MGTRLYALELPASCTQHTIAVHRKLVESSSFKQFSAIQPRALLPRLHGRLHRLRLWSAAGPPHERQGHWEVSETERKDPSGNCTKKWQDRCPASWSPQALRLLQLLLLCTSPRGLWTRRFHLGPGIHNSQFTNPRFTKRCVPCRSELDASGYAFSIVIVDASYEWCGRCPGERFCRGCVIQPDEALVSFWMKNF